jgi:hypothetical protein
MWGMSVFHISSTGTLKKIYFAYFYSVMKYGIIFWGYLCNSKKIFTLYIKIVKVGLVQNL